MYIGRMIDPWTPIDPLGEALHFLRMRGVFYTRSEFSAPWGLDLPAMPECLMFHVVTSGYCWLHVGDRPPRRLERGDFALVPHGEGHQLLSGPEADAAPLFDLTREQISERYEILCHGAGGEATHMICGAVRLGHPAAHHLVSFLPKQIIIEAWRSPQMDWMQSTLRLMAAEAETPRPGGETVITRLADILVIQAIRAWIAQDPVAQTGWLGALQDPQIGQALLRIHRAPAEPWTVAKLAATVAMSRSAFSARFTTFVGEPPMQYVRRWRMYAALTWLREEKTPMVDLADRLGYQSEAAFSRAFKRVIGISPGAARRQALAAPLPA